MKFSAILLTTLAAQTTAFAPSIQTVRTTTSLSLQLTGEGAPAATDAKAAKSSAEDLEKATAALMAHFESLDGESAGVDDSDDDTPYVPPTPPPAPVAAAKSSTGIELWSVDYDSAAMLAYKAAGSKGDFATFKTQYLADTSAMVGKKNPYKK